MHSTSIFVIFVLGGDEDDTLCDPWCFDLCPWWEWWRWWWCFSAHRGSETSEASSNEGSAEVSNSSEWCLNSCLRGLHPLCFDGFSENFWKNAIALLFCWECGFETAWESLLKLSDLLLPAIGRMRPEATERLPCFGLDVRSGTESVIFETKLWHLIDLRLSAPWIDELISFGNLKGIYQTSNIMNNKQKKLSNILSMPLLPGRVAELICCPFEIRREDDGEGELKWCRKYSENFLPKSWPT